MASLKNRVLKLEHWRVDKEDNVCSLSDAALTKKIYECIHELYESGEFDEKEYKYFLILFFLEREALRAWQENRSEEYETLDKVCEKVEEIYKEDKEFFDNINKLISEGKSKLEHMNELISRINQKNIL